MYKQFFNRATIVALLVIGSLASCKQQTVDPTKPTPDQPAAELSSRVTGQYTFKQVSADGKIYSADDADLQGAVKITRVSASSVSLQMNINTASTNEAVMNGSVTDITVKDAGNNEVSLVEDTDWSESLFLTVHRCG